MDTPESGTAQANEQGEGAKVTLENESAQQVQNISILENSNGQESAPPAPPAPPAPDPDNSWVGDPRYFQTGKKAGQLKPGARTGGLDASKAASSEFEGLRPEDLRASSTAKKPEAEAPKKSAKSERKIVEAKTGAKLAMRVLDTLTGWISRGEYGANFTEKQATERNKYRAELEKDWEDYLLTLDIPLHPGLVVAFGSITYVADAFNTPAGKERGATIKEKFVSKAVGMFFGRKK